MSARDGVDDRDYDTLREAGFLREECWAILDVVRSPLAPPPNAAKDKANRQSAGVRSDEKHGRPHAPPTP